MKQAHSRSFVVAVVGAMTVVFAAVVTVTPAGATANSWTDVTPMPTARNSLAAATGSDGLVYAIGGTVSYSQDTTAVEAYDAATNVWAAKASLSSARSGLAAVAGPDGLIYAIGGANFYGGISGAVEAYDPATNTWSPKASMLTPRVGLAAAVGTDGMIYAIGGVDRSGSVVNTVEQYNPRSDMWFPAASMPTARYDLAATTGSDGLIYAIGGTGPATVEAFNPAANAWVSKASMTTPRASLAATTGPDGHVYAIGGIGSSPLASVEVYDSTSNAWTLVGSMSTARGYLAASTGPDGRIYAIGGGTSSTNSMNTVEAYDVDSTPPTTTITLSGGITGTSPWWTSAPQAVVSAEDGGGSGVASIRCVVDPTVVPTGYDDLPAASCSYATATTMAEGTHTLYAAAIDNVGNKGTLVSRTVKVDSLAPQINTPTFSKALYIGQQGVTASATGVDGGSGLAGTVACGSVDTTMAGDHTLTCAVSDNAGNRTSVDFHYLVEYQIVGFLSPASGAKVRGGSSVTAKIALADASGTSISDTTAASLLSAPCRVTFSAAGAQPATAQCMSYSASKNVFTYAWTLAKTPTGSATITVTVTYPGTTAISTRSENVTIR